MESPRTGRGPHHPVDLRRVCMAVVLPGMVSAGATAAASAIVSGSIVIVGNVVYWFEKQGRRLRETPP